MITDGQETTMKETTPIYDYDGSYHELPEDPKKNYRRRAIIAGIFGCFILVFMIVFIVIGVRNSMQPFEGFVVYPKCKDNKIIYKINEDLSEYVQSLNSILEEYKPKAGDTAIDCPGNTAPTNKDTVCRFNTSHIEAALPADFGYQDGAPTIILQLMPIVGWQPRVYINDSTDMSQWKLSKDIIPIDHVPVVCQGRESIDQENLGKVKIVPKKGFPLKYFPYTGQKGYQYPLVAVQFLNPLVGVMIRIKCELWDLGMALDERHPLRVNIYLQVDSDGAIWPWPKG